jgi:hypothetical protein
MSADPLVVAVIAAEIEHDTRVARKAPEAELLASYRACLLAQLALAEGYGESDAARALREHIRRYT